MSGHESAKNGKTGEVELTKAQGDQVVEHLSLVDKVLNGMRSRLASHADYEELRSVGIRGLISAVQNYDGAREASFRGYAALKIRGAILDELRRIDWMSRSSRRKLKQVEYAVGVLEQKLGRAPSDEELRDHLNLEPKSFEKLQRQIQHVSFVSLDYRGEGEDGEMLPLEERIADEGQTPGVDQVEADELEMLLLEHLEALPDRQKKVLALYYVEKLKLAEIAELFEVTEARICQIHTQALAMLKKKLTSYR